MAIPGLQPTSLSNKAIRKRQQKKNGLSDKEKELKKNVSDIFYASSLCWNGSLSFDSDYKLHIGDIRGHKVQSMHYYRKNKFFLKYYEQHTPSTIFMLGIVNQLRYRANDSISSSLRISDLTYFKDYIGGWRKYLVFDIQTLVSKTSGMTTWDGFYTVLFNAANAFYQIDEQYRKETPIKPYSLYLILKYSSYIKQIPNSKSTFRKILIQHSKRINEYTIRPSHSTVKEEEIREMVSMLDDVLRFLE